MRRRTICAVALVTVAGIAACSGEDDSGSAGSESVDSISTVVETTESAGTGTSSDDPASADTSAVDSVALTLDTAPSADAAVSVPVSSITFDRVVRRGSAGIIQQGQTFLVEDDAELASISFVVAAEDQVPRGEMIGIAIYEVADPVAAVPSGFVDIGAGSEPVMLALPAAIEADSPTTLTFSFPGLQLAGDQQYAALLSLGDGGQATELYVQHAVADEYADGLAIRFEGAVWKVDRVVGDQAFELVFAT